MTNEEDQMDEALHAAFKLLSEHYDAFLIIARHSPDGETGSVQCVWDAHISEAMGLAEVAKMRTGNEFLRGRDDE